MENNQQQEPNDTTPPVLVIEKEPTQMSYMELRDTFKHTGKRQNEIIKLMAKKLGETLGDRFTKPQIKDKIAADLQGYVTEPYVRMVLGPEYTQQKFNSAASKKAKTQVEVMGFNGGNRGGGVRSDTTLKIIIPDEVMDWIDDERGDDSPQKFIINKLKELAGLD